MGIQVIAIAWMSKLVDYLPVGYAFGAGMVATVNPCGFAMLPVYLSLYMGTEDSEFYQSSRWLRVWKALWITLVVSAGFVILFGIMGSLLSAGGMFLIEAMPWIALVIGIALAVMGGWLFLGHHVSAGFIHQLADKIGNPKNVSIKGFFLFGVAFAAASLSCTLPIFLVVVGSAMTTGDFLFGMIQFFSYSLGMGTVLLFLTLGIALFKEGFIVGKLRKFMPWVQQVSAVFLMLAGGYIVYYWLTNGQLLS